MSRFVATLTEHRTLLRDFVRRDLRARYVGSSMGFFWSIIFPVINLFLFMFVFRILLRARWGDSMGELEVALIMLAGIMVWTGFSEAVSRSTSSLLENANLIQKVVFPAVILPVYITSSALLNMCLGLPIVFAAVAWFGHLSPPAGAIETPVEAVEVWEGFEAADANGATIPYPRVFVGLERAWSAPVTFDLAYGGTAERGVDYLAPHDQLVLPEGTPRMYLPIVPVRDREEEGDETIEVRVTATSGGIELWQSATTLNLHDSMLPVEETTPPDAAATAPYAAAGSDQYNPLRLGLPLITVPLLLAVLAVFSTALGAFFAAFNLYWRDTQHLIGVGLTVWMFATPIFYPAFLVEAAGMEGLLLINPMHWFIDAFRDVTLYGMWPDPWLIGGFTALSFLLLGISGRFFAKHAPQFSDLL